MKQRRSAAQWCKIVALFEATTGMTQRTFAQKHDLKKHLFRTGLTVFVGCEGNKRLSMYPHNLLRLSKSNLNLFHCSLWIK